MLIDRQCINSLKTIYRPGTLRNYRSKSNSYLRFSEFYGLSPFPTTEWNLIRYALYLANGMTSYDSVKGYLSGVKKLHELGGYSFPTELKLLAAEMRSIKYELASAVKKAVPVTPHLLKRIFKLVDIKDVVQVAGFTALVVGFMLFLRKSNLVPDTQQSFDPKHQLTWGDLWWNGDILMVIIRWSKTLQYRQKELELPLVPANTVQVCAVYWIKYLKCLTKPKIDDPLLSYPSGGKLVPLTYDKLGKMYRTWLSQLGITQLDNYTLHGLRRGGANHALTVGICGEDVQLMGDWKSQAYMEYIDLNMERRLFNMVHFIEKMDEKLEGDDWDGCEDPQREFWFAK